MSNSEGRNGSSPSGDQDRNSVQVVHDKCITDSSDDGRTSNDKPAFHDGESSDKKSSDFAEINRLLLFAVIDSVTPAVLLIPSIAGILPNSSQTSAQVLSPITQDDNAPDLQSSPDAIATGLQLLASMTSRASTVPLCISLGLHLSVVLIGVGCHLRRWCLGYSNPAREDALPVIQVRCDPWERSNNPSPCIRAMHFILLLALNSTIFGLLIQKVVRPILIIVAAFVVGAILWVTLLPSL